MNKVPPGTVWGGRGRGGEGRGLGGEGMEWEMGVVVWSGVW